MRLSSLLIVDGARFNWDAIERIDSPAVFKGTVALGDRVARSSVDMSGIRSDRGGELIECRSETNTLMPGFDAKFIMSASQVLDERVAADHG